MKPERLRIVLLSPKGPLYRHRGGIFGKSLRYKPLTLPTLASLIPTELKASVVCFDEGIADIDTDMNADLVGITVITGTAKRAYELARIFRQRGITVVLGGPHVTLAPEDAQPHADSIVVGYAEDESNRVQGKIGTMVFTRTLMQWKDVDLSNRTKFDAYISSSLSRLGNQRVQKVEVEKPTATRIPFRMYDNSGNVSIAL